MGQVPQTNREISRHLVAFRDFWNRHAMLDLRISLLHHLFQGKDGLDQIPLSDRVDLLFRTAQEFWIRAFKPGDDQPAEKQICFVALQFALVASYDDKREHKFIVLPSQVEAILTNDEATGVQSTHPIRRGCP